MKKMSINYWINGYGKKIPWRSMSKSYLLNVLNLSSTDPELFNSRYGENKSLVVERIELEICRRELLEIIQRNDHEKALLLISPHKLLRELVNEKLDEKNS